MMASNFISIVSLTVLHKGSVTLRVQATCGTSSSRYKQQKQTKKSFSVGQEVQPKQEVGGRQKREL